MREREITRAMSRLDERCVIVSRYKHNVGISCTLIALFSRRRSDTKFQHKVYNRRALNERRVTRVKRVLIEAVSVDGLTTDAGDIRESLARTNRKEEGI